MQPIAGERRHVVDLLFALALFCVFAATALMVVLIGARVYRGTVRGMDRNMETGASLTYLTNKIRQHDAPEGVRIEALDGSPALVLTASREGEVFETWIYHSDGALRELLVARGDTALAEYGQPILELQDFSVEQVAAGLYRLAVTGTDGERAETILSLSGGGAVMGP